eukprot:13303430-Alexandrium_andersonii.AAC.1
MNRSHGPVDSEGCGRSVRWDEVARRSARSAVSCACHSGQFWRHTSRDSGAWATRRGRKPNLRATAKPGRGVAP